MRYSILFSLLLSAFQLLAQYNNPYRITYDGANYFVTNKGNGTVTRIDTGFATSTVISGLYSPNDIFFGTVAGSSSLAVIDSNRIKLFNPTTFASIIQLPIGNAVEAHDGVFDPTNANLFYISDRGGNKIIKGSIGAPPFYPITYSVLTSGITRPSGMMFDSKGRLLVVEDTTSASIHWINTSTGYDSVLTSTSLDYLSDISEDAQGNYYITCWGDDYLYRLDSTLGSPFRLIAYNNPSGMYVNNAYDYLALCCFNCNKLEFKAFHLFAPLADLTLCTSDSFFANFNPIYWGIGTYDSDNYFILELSDSNGSYANAQILDSIPSDTIPPFFHSKVQAGIYAGSGHRYRFRSTSPAFTTPLDKAINFYPQPKAYISMEDSLTLCKGSSIRLGTDPISQHSYTWSPAIAFDDPTASKPLFRPGQSGSYPVQLEEYDSVFGCINSNRMFIEVIDKLTLDQMPDSLAMCPGDTISVGIDEQDLFFSWSGSDSLMGTTGSNPSFYDVASADLIVIFSTFDLLCSGRDTVHVTVYDRPSFEAISGTYLDSACVGVQEELELVLDTNLHYLWTARNGQLDTTTQPIRITTSINPAPMTLIAFLTDQRTGCEGVDSGWIKQLMPPPSQFPDDHSVHACMGDTVEFGLVLDSAYRYSWPDTFRSVILSDSLRPRFSSNIAAVYLDLEVIVTDANGCSGPSLFDLFFYDVPEPLNIDTVDGRSASLLGLVNRAVLNDLNADSSLRIQWAVNGSITPSTADSLGHFDRNDLSDGDTLQAELFRVIGSDTLCAFLSEPYVKANLGSITELKALFKLFPNPSFGSLMLQAPMPMDRIDLISGDGTLIDSWEPLAKQWDLDLRSIRAGVYVLAVRSGQATVHLRFVRL